MVNTQTAKLRHAEFYFSLAEKENSNLRVLDIEFPQILQAVGWLVHQESDDASNLFLAYLFALQNYFQRRSMYSDLIEYCEHALIITRRISINPGRVLNIKYNALYALGQWHEAHHVVEEALAATHKSQWDQYALAMYNLGRLQINRGDYRSALHTLREAETLLSAGDLTNELANIKAEIAAYQLNQHNLDEALKLYLEVDEIRRHVNPTGTSGHTLLMLGVIYRRKREYATAYDYLTKLKDMGIADGDRATIATALHHIAWTYLEEGAVVNAEEAATQAQELYKQIDDIRGLGDALDQSGVIALLKGEYSHAEENFIKALDIRRRMGNEHGIASIWLRLASTKLKQKRYLSFIMFLIQCLYLYQRLGSLTSHWLIYIVKRVFRGF